MERRVEEQKNLVGRMKRVGRGSKLYHAFHDQDLFGQPVSLTF